MDSKKNITYKEERVAHKEEDYHISKKSVSDHGKELL